ncbi:hypothetical protein L1987_26664 [Smallanthus sonchifolius]|uniref:Uncharacterized protein n=1 Tax=Smallanthus sonchifolius TaxID=185202 RepID=A0ACB9IB85_9ASTR|nr:hypothetical protein L1987_26664 [Smallanthus sonchifolius]
MIRRLRAEDDQKTETVLEKTIGVGKKEGWLGRGKGIQRTWSSDTVMSFCNEFRCFGAASFSLRNKFTDEALSAVADTTYFEFSGILSRHALRVLST